MTKSSKETPGKPGPKDSGRDWEELCRENEWRCESCGAIVDVSDMDFLFESGLCRACASGRSEP